MDAKLKNVKSSLAQKLFAMIYSLYIFFTLSATFAHMFFDFKNAEIRVHDDLDFKTKMVKAPISDALWNYNDDVIQQIIGDLSLSPTVLGIKVEDDQNKIWRAGAIPKNNETNEFFYFNYETGQDEKKPSKTVAQPYHVSKDLTYTNAKGDINKIGTLTIYTSSELVFNQVKDIFIIIIINAILKSMALWGLFLIFGKKILTKPLNALTKATQQVRDGNLSPDPVAIDMKWPTELDLLIDNFEAMTDEIHQSKNKLISAKVRLRDIIDSMPSMIFGLNQNLSITEWNKEIAKYIKIEEDQALGKSFKDLFPSYDFLSEMIKKVQSENMKNQLLNQVVYKDDKRHYQDIIVYPIGTLGDVIVRIDDVTERANLEKAMVQNEKMSSVGSLATGMAKEINGPISMISQAVQNITRRLDGTMEANQKAAEALGLDINVVNNYLDQRKVLSFVQSIEQAALSASKTLEHLLEFSTESNASKAASVFEDLVNKALDLAQTDQDLKRNLQNIKIEKDFAKDLSKVFASPIQIEQVILTILKLQVQTLSTKTSNDVSQISFKLYESEGFVRLEMKDNGPGLDEETQRRIFEPFYTMKGVGQASVGMGLSVSYKIIVESHKGDLSVSSGSESGAIFTISLPIA